MALYCVYTHKNPVTKEIVYIGSGTEKRPWNFSGRSKLWQDYNKTYGIEVEILIPNLICSQARELENGLIQKHNPILNQRTPVIEYTKLTENIKDFVYYSEDSATNLKWKKSVGTRARTDCQAGTLTYDKDKRARAAYIKIDGISYKISRIVYYLTHGNDPGELVVDHLDGNPHNNTIQNLRLVTLKVNACNRASKGVHYRAKTTAKSSECWQAYVSFNSVRYSKSFPVAKYGSQAKQLAIEWRAMKCRELNTTAGAEFTTRHGNSEN